MIFPTSRERWDMYLKKFPGGYCKHIFGEKDLDLSFEKFNQKDSTKTRYHGPTWIPIFGACV